MSDLPRLISALDEPADPLSICLLHLARMTAREVKVVLGGDGGDELFGGYDRYAADRWLDAYRMVPEAVRNLVTNQVLHRLPDQFTFKSFTHKLRWVDQMARKTGGERYAASMQYFWFNEAHRAELYTPASAPGSRAATGRVPARPVRHANATEPVDRMMYVDVMSRLPGQSLMILDRATMAYSLEVPLAVPRSALCGVHGAGARLAQGARAEHLRLPRAPARRALPAARGAARRQKQGFASPLMYIMEDEVRSLAPTCSSIAISCATAISRRDGSSAGRGTSSPRRDHGNRIWLLLERGGLVSALRVRPVDHGPRGRHRRAAATRSPGAGRLNQGHAGACGRGRGAKWAWVRVEFGAERSLACATPVKAGRSRPFPAKKSQVNMKSRGNSPRFWIGAPPCGK